MINKREIAFFETKKIDIIVRAFDTSSSLSSIGFPPLEKNTTKSFVYILLEKNAIVYFGASRIRQRIGQHKDKKFDSCLFYYSEQAFLLESILIRRFRTRYNKCKIATDNHFSICMHCNERQVKSEPHKVLQNLPPTFRYGKDNELIFIDGGYDFVDCTCNNGHPKYEFTCNDCFNEI